MAGPGGPGQEATPPWSPLRQPPRTWRGALKAGHVDRSLGRSVPYAAGSQVVYLTLIQVYTKPSGLGSNSP